MTPDERLARATSPAAARREADRLDRVFAATGSTDLGALAADYRREAVRLEADDHATTPARDDQIDAGAACPSVEPRLAVDNDAASQHDNATQSLDTAPGLDPDVETRVAEILGYKPELPRAGQIATVKMRESAPSDDGIDAVVARICSEAQSGDCDAEADTAEAVAARINAA